MTREPAEVLSFNRLLSAAQAAQRSTTAFEQRLDQVSGAPTALRDEGFRFRRIHPRHFGLTRAAKDAAIDRSTITCWI